MELLQFPLRHQDDAFFLVRMTMFRGRFDCKIDDKGRLLIPLAYRQALSQKNNSLVITNNIIDGNSCLDVYSYKQWQQLEKHINKLPQFKKEVQDYKRFYLSSGQPIELDKSKRILIPVGLRNFAKLSDEVVCVGMGDKFEIWPSQLWKKVFKTAADNFDAINEELARLLGEQKD